MGNKLKTRKAVAKRFKVTGTGKIVHGSSGLNHLKRKKDKSAQRNLHLGGLLEGGVARRARRMLGASAAPTSD